MHIPDGYLSPLTCGLAYACAIPCWRQAFARVQQRLHTRLVPLLSVFSAFSFVVMMFNLPLPGGTTGHAVGVAIATIVLGPWAAIVALSIALLIQAIFFGDGGITSFGANCLNMAIVGTFVAHWSYQLIAGKTALNSARRVVAAGLAGYLAINAAALCAAVEFGVQPLFFHDATGAPVYAPYPLHIAVPAMMIGHLSFAGLAEALISAGLLAYLQRANPELLSILASPSVAPQTLVDAGKAARKLWLWLAGLMVLSPLGLLAAGTAWGEWAASDFADPQTRSEILRASQNTPPPTHAPQGLEHLSSIWSAPLPDYAPAFMHNASFGYILSAVFGAGVIMTIYLLLARWQKRAPQN